MTKSIKAVFFDVDATIYSHAIHDALPSTKIALNRLHKKGIKVGVATSRCRFEMLNTPEFFRNFPFDGCIYDGGALVMEQDRVVSAQAMEAKDVEKVIAFAKEHDLSVRYSTIDGDFFAFEPRQEDKDIFFRLYLNTPVVKAFENDQVLNILIYADTPLLQEKIQSLLPNITIVNHDRVLEINGGQIDKSKGVNQLANAWNISMDEIMCFGDGANDVEFIKAAGIGVAMGNGCKAVKEVADFVSESIDDDGVFIALRKYELI